MSLSPEISTLRTAAGEPAAADRSADRRPWLVLFGRAGLFAALQAAAALLYLGAGAEHPWEASTAWSLTIVFTANLVLLALLVRIFRSEGRRYLDLFRIDRQNVKRDLLALLAVTLAAGPIAFLPNILLARWLFGDPEATLAILVRPLPAWVVYANLLLFPVTQGLVELAAYFGYVMPRLEARGMDARLAVSIPAVMLGLQHAAAPLVFDLRFIAWRGLMFIPFAFLVGLTLQRRPSLLPYLAIVHVLMDLSYAAMFIG